MCHLLQKSCSFCAGARPCIFYMCCNLAHVARGVFGDFPDTGLCWCCDGAFFVRRDDVRHQLEQNA